MAGSNILAMSESARLAEWSTRLEPYPPQVKAADKANGQRVDKDVRLLTKRWIYPVIHLEAVGGGFIVPFEAYADEDGLIWWAERSKPPKYPIGRRADPRKKGVSDEKVHLPMTDDKGRALTVRLLYAPFRLSSKAIAVLAQADKVKAITGAIPPLWTWKKGIDDQALVHSSDGFSLVPEPLWMIPGGSSTPIPVWVGSDPFAIAERRSDRFVKERRKYAAIYEPEDPEKKKELERIVLGQAIDAAIARQPELHEKYAQYIDIARLNDALEAFESKRGKMRAAFEKKAEELCAVLSSPLFRVFQESSYVEEGFEDGDEYHEALAEHLRVLAHALRNLENSTKGLELMVEWAKASFDDPTHFFNRVALPTQPLPTHIFKTVRWSSKSVVNIVRRVAPFVAKNRAHFVQRISDAIVFLGIVQTHGDVEAAIVTMKKSIGELGEPLGFSGKGSKMVEFEQFSAKMSQEIESWIDAGKGRWPKAPQRLRIASDVAVFLLDGFNVIIAWGALSEAKGPEATFRAAANVGAASASTVASIIRPFVKGNQLTLRVRCMFAANAVSAVILMELNFWAALDALEKDDNDRAAALAVAFVAEAVTAGTYLYLLLVGAAATPVFLVVVGAIAAAAYIAATWLEDDPLAEFLENCEWGSSPYGKPSFHPLWGEQPVAKWQGDFILQSRLLLRVLSHFTISWDLKSWPGVNVKVNLRRRGMRIVATYTGVDAKGATVTEKRVFEATDLPSSVPMNLKIEPKKRFVNLAGIQRLWLKVWFRPDHGMDQDTFEVLLMEDGKGITSGEKSLLA